MSVLKTNIFQRKITLCFASVSWVVQRVSVDTGVSCNSVTGLIEVNNGGGEMKRGEIGCVEIIVLMLGLEDCVTILFY